MFIESIVIGFVVALFRGGKMKNIEKIHIKAWYLFVLAGVIQLSLSLLKGNNLLSGSVFFDRYFFYIHLFTYLLLIIGLFFNLDKKFMIYIFLGMLLNAIVIFANGGKMPVSFKGAKGYEHFVEEMPVKPFNIKHTIVNKDTRFVYLADVIPLSRPYPLARIISIGDIIIMIGVYLFFQEGMVGKKVKKNELG